MAATNYTPIQLYHSTTASAAPTAGNLTDGELAINIADGKLFYKDSGGAVQVIATKGTGTIGGSNTQVQYNSSGALAGSANFTFNGTTATINTLNLTNALLTTYGGTGLSSYTAGDMLYYASGTALSKLAVGTNGYILTSNGSAPTWTAPSSIVVSTATNLAGGAAGSVPYQSALDTTTFLAIGAANRVMTSSGSAPQWVTSLTGLTGVSSSAVTNTSLTSGRVVYSTTGGAQTDSTNLTFNGTTLTAGGLSTGGSTSLTKLVTVGGSSFTLPSALSASAPAKLYVSTGGVTDGSSAIGATNALGAIVSLGSTSVDATNTSVTYTNLATLYIADAPAAGTNITITNPYAMYIASGASYFGGNVSLANNPTLSGGTANGVLYLNGSKVATSGSALTFDGTNLSLTASGAIYKVPNAGGSIFSAGGNDGVYIDGTSHYVATYANGSEQMRLTSTGLGIGTSSPAVKLDVAGSASAGIRYKSSGAYGSIVADNTGTTGGGSFAARQNGTQYAVFGVDGAIQGNTSTDTAVFADGTGSSIKLYTNGSPTLKAILDSSGNLGLGVTPSAWSGYTALQVSNGFSVWSSGVSNSRMNANTYYNGGYKYVGTGTATMYEQDGYHAWYTAASGTAGNAITFTQAMTLDASGNLGIGTSSPVYKLQVASGATSTSAFFNSTAATAYGATGYNGGTARLQLVGGNASGATTGINFSNGGLFEAYFGGVQEAGGAAAFVWQGYSGSAYAERMRLDSSGNLGLGVTPSAWNSDYKATQMGRTASFFGRVNSNQTGLAENAYRDSGGSWRYLTNGTAESYEVDSGAHRWYNAASGTAGNAITFTQAMTLDASGRLGISTTSPLNYLDLGDASNGNGVTWSNYSNVFSEYSSGALILSSNYYGNVGSGGYKTAVTATFGAAGIQISGTSGSGTSGLIQFFVDPATSKTAGNAFTPTERARIDSSGNFSIGGAVAQAKLNVITGLSGTYGSAAIWITDNATTSMLLNNTSSGVSSIWASGALTFGAGGNNNTEAARIDSSGNLLVGTTSSKSKTVIQGQLSVGETGAVSGAAGIYLYANDALSDNSFLCRQSSGTGTTTWYIGNQAITTSSDIRLKENVKPSERNALELLNQWEIIDHTWNDPSDKCENNRNSRGVWTGISAQQVQQVTPWLVNKPIEDINEDGSINPWTMDFGYAVPLLVKAIQEQQAQIESLRKRLADAGIA